jgi:sulfite reductase alpha subunit-like flavoprotein
MAKLSFKDMIFKVLRKDEEAPANATGTAVAGTGDDSSTVVVKKKKELQKKLMTRMGIKESIDKAIPDLEYPKDEIKERANQLKELALKSEGERALARDKSTDQPKKYVSGLTDKQKKSHDRHLEKQGKKSDSDKSAYKQSPADKVAKTKPSKHTNKFKQMYGEDYLNEKIAGLEKKAKKSGMPYSILKKVYDRGMAAWKGGHRPGTTPQQWAFARVNSFTTKSSGTWGKADSDLAKQVRGS